MRVGGPRGKIEVSLVGASRIECRGEGHLRLTEAVAAQREIDAILERAGTYESLFDGTAIEGFELGLPMIWVRWSLPRIHRFRRSAIVGRPGPLLAVARPFPYLLPSLPIALCERRDEALAFLDARDPSGPLRVPRSATSEDRS